MEGGFSLTIESGKRSVIFLLLLFSLSALMGCANVNKSMSKDFIYSGVDFTRYTQNGFLVTHKEYLGEYESIGLFEVTAYPQIIERGSATSEVNFDTWNKHSRSVYVERLSVYEVLDSLYEYVRDIGADALVELKIERNENRLSDVTFETVTISGFAIKRSRIN